MNTQNENQFHNPQNLSTPGEGYTFKLKGSIKEAGDEIWNNKDFPDSPHWEKSVRMNGDCLDERFTYRRKLTEPKESPNCAICGHSRNMEYDPENKVFICTGPHPFQGGVIPKSSEPDYNSRENKIAVFTAWLDGREVQGMPKGKLQEWTDIPDPVWNFEEWYYRVKPPEPTKREEGVKLDWNMLPNEASWVAVDESVLYKGTFCYWATTKPRLGEDGRWKVDSGVCGKVHIPYIYEGDKKDSLTPRPEQRKGVCMKCGQPCGESDVKIIYGLPRYLHSKCEQRKEEDDESHWQKDSAYRAAVREPRKVPLSAKDCPPGSVFSGDNGESWFAPSFQGKGTVKLGGVHYSYAELMNRNMRILRPGSTEFEPCYKFEEVRE